MSLLMDALRRAESGRPAEAQQPTPPTSQPSDLSLVPLEPAQESAAEPPHAGAAPPAVDPQSFANTDAQAQRQQPPAPRAAPSAERLAPAPVPARAAQMLAAGRTGSWTLPRALMLLGLLASGAIVAGYYYWTLSQYPLRVLPLAPAPAPGDARTADVAAQTVLPAAAAENAAQPPSEAAPQRANAGAGTPLQRPVPAPDAPDVERPRQGAAAPAPAPYSGATPEAIPALGALQIRHSRQTPDTAQRLQDAYAAFIDGDLEKSGRLYRQVLQTRPEDRDALLGMAAIEVQHNDLDAARERYRALLRRDPRDPAARAALVSLPGNADPVAGESELKGLLDAEPKAAYLHFALGNLYARQQRWSEAQRAYFDAVRYDPQHPDYAFNLAVSLDRLGRSQPALQYYRRAAALAAHRAVRFDRAALARRLQALDAANGSGS